MNKKPIELIVNPTADTCFEVGQTPQVLNLEMQRGFRYTIVVETPQEPVRLTWGGGGLIAGTAKYRKNGYLVKNISAQKNTTCRLTVTATSKRNSVAIRVVGMDFSLPEILRGMLMFPLQIPLEWTPLGLGPPGAVWANVKQFPHYNAPKGKPVDHYRGFHHTSNDFKAPPGSKVYPLAPGIVTKAGASGGKWGTYVKAEHALVGLDGKPLVDEHGPFILEAVYEHVDFENLVEGHMLDIRQSFGTTHDLGEVEGEENHLHLCVRRKRPDLERRISMTAGAAHFSKFGPDGDGFMYMGSSGLYIPRPL